MTIVRPRILTALLAAASLIGALAAQPAPAAAPAPTITSFQRLSNEVTYTRWTRTAVVARVYSHPSPYARVVARTHYDTEDGFPEVYLVLARAGDDRGDQWLAIRVPGRPNGRFGWVREDYMEPLRLVRTRLVIDRRRLSATLYRSGRRIWFSRVGVGKPGTPTPPGRFWVRERIKVNPENGLYGAWAFGTAAYSVGLTDWPGGGVIGVHGTNQPSLIPGRPSHGCVRVPNPAVRRLARLMPLGTSVWIL